MSGAIYGDFSYVVKLNVTISLTWAKMLKDAAANHYDALCKSSGESGVIDGLHNCANWTAEHPNAPSMLEVTWSDCDLMAKVMEQARWSRDYRPSIDREISQWLLEVKEKINLRHREIVAADNTWRGAVAQGLVPG